MSTISLKDLGLFFPELILGTTVCLLFVGDLAVGRAAQKRRYLTWLALAGLAAAAAAAIHTSTAPPTGAFLGQIAVDPIGTTFKLIFVAVTAVTVITSLLSQELPDRHMGEYYALLLSITFGMFLMAGANDLLMVYLGIELVSIVSYAMAGYRLHDRRSSEAALKYVIYGGAASGMMLFGISLLYGLLGTTELTSIYRALAVWAQTHLAIATDVKAFPVTLLLSIVFIFAGIGYKIAVVPFHMWSPDVYEGAPTPFSGFLSVGPKAAGFALLMRAFIGTFVAPGEGGTVEPSGFLADGEGMMALAIDLPLPAMIGIIAAVTMTLGNLAAIPQNNVKRLLAYSSIAHAGYLLMAFVVLSESAVQAVTLYIIFYFLMNIGAFTVCQIVRDRTGGELVHDFRGLGAREPAVAVFMTIFLLSLTGLPPLAGFIGKFYLFAAVLERGGFWYVVLAIIGVANSAISLYYYMRVASAMWLASAPDETPLGANRGYIAVTGLLAALTLAFGIYWEPLRVGIKGSTAFYRSPPTSVSVSQAVPSANTPALE